LEPEPFKRLVHSRQLHQVAENQFSLAPGITGVDDCVDILAFHQPLQKLVSSFGFLDRLQEKLVRNDRQVLEAPLAAFFVLLGRQPELDKVTNRGGDDVPIVFEIVAVPLKFSQGAGIVESDTRLLCDYQCFSHPAPNFSYPAATGRMPATQRLAT
jgi:hypothetical protein